MAKFADPKTYAKNLLKSAKYLTADTIKGINPDLTDYISDTGSATKEMLQSAKSFKQNYKSKFTDLIGKDGVDAIKSVKGNLLEDLRTGKFYNADRVEENEGKMMKAMGFDFDFDDIDFDTDDTDNDESTENSDGVKASTIIGLGEEITRTQAKAAEYSSLRIAKTSRTNTKAMMAHNEQLFGRVNVSIASLNASILNFHNDIASPLNTHISNATSFFSKATEEMGKQTKMLENITKILTDRFAPANGFGASRKKTAWEEVVGSNGLINFSNYGKLVKNRAINESEIGSMLGLLGAFGEGSIGGIIGQATASPISTLLGAIIKSKIAKGPTAKALERTMNVLKGGTAQFASKVHKTAISDTGLLGSIAKMLDIVPTGKAKLDFSKYNKGRQDWTGKDAKALRDVIPTQLANILAAITGKPAKIFNYETGKFVNARQAAKDFSTRRRDNISRSTSSLRNEVIDSFIKEDELLHKDDNTPSYTKNSRAVRNLSKDFDTLMTLMTVTNVDFGSFKNTGDILDFAKQKEWIGTNGILSEESVKIIDRMIFKNSGARGRLAGASYSAKISNNAFMANSSDSTISNIANGSDITSSGRSSIGINMLNALDKYGNSVYNYLQDYYKQLRTIANNTAGVGKRGFSNNKGKVDTSGYQMQDVELRDRSPKTQGGASSSGSTASASSGGSYDDAWGRQEYNPYTKEYEDPKEKLSATSRFTRQQEEKTSPISRGVDKINSYLDKIFFGNWGDRLKDSVEAHNGIFGFIHDLPKMMADAIPKGIDKLKEYAKKKWKDFKESEWGQDFFGATKNMIKGHFKNTWDYGKARAADVYRFFNNGQAAPWEADLTGSYRGGMVRKSGMASVSEGEMIIPAEMNPYYTGNMTKAQRQYVERANYKKWLKAGGDQDDFFGMFAGGTPRVKGKKKRDLTPEDKEEIKRLHSEGYKLNEIAHRLSKDAGKVKSYLGKVEKDLKKKIRKAEKQAIKNAAVYAVNRAEESFEENVVDPIAESKPVGKAKEIIDKATNSKAAQKAGEFLSTAAEKLESTTDRLFGDKKIYQNAKGLKNEVVRTAKLNMPKTAASGALGALIGAAATGSGLGLLGGLVTGAGIHIIKNSDAISQSLFGQYDSDKKEWVGGKLPAKVTNFIKKHVPNATKAGTIGSIAGLLGLAPGGILGGFVLGAGLELASTTDTFKDIMFGHPDVNGNRQGGIMGSIKLRIVDPMANFVKDGIKKVGGFFKENVLDPVKGMFKPLTDWFKGKALRIASGVGEGIKNKLGWAVDKLVRRFDFILNPVTKVVKGAGKKVLGAAKGIISYPGKVLKNMATDLEGHNIARGYSSKTIQERMAMEGKRYGIGALKTIKNSAYTKWAANATKEQIVDASHFMNGNNAFNKTTAKMRLNLSRTIVASLNNGGAGNPGVVKQIQNLIRNNTNNDFSELISLIESLDESVIGPEVKTKVLDLINKTQQKIQHEIDKNQDFKQKQDEFFRSIGITDEKEKQRFIKHGKIQSQIDVKNLNKIEKQREEQYIAEAKKKDELFKNTGITDEEDNQDDAAQLLKEQEKSDPIRFKNYKNISSIKDLIGGIAVKMGVKSSDIPKSSEEKTTSETKDLLNAPSTKKDNNDKSDRAGEVEEHVDPDTGLVGQYVRNSKGELCPDESDAATNQILDTKRRDREIKNKFYNGGLISSIKGLFSGKDDKDDEDVSIFDKLKGLAGGLLSKGGGLLGGLFGGVGRSLGSILIKLLPGAIVSGLALAAGGKLGEKYAGTGKDSGMYAGMDAEARKAEVENMNLFQKFGLGVDGIENTLRGRDTTKFQKDDYQSEYVSDSYLKGLGKNALLSFDSGYRKSAMKMIDSKIGKIPLLGKPLAGITKLSMAPGAALSKVREIAKNRSAKVLENVAEDAVKAADDVIPTLSSRIYKVLGCLASKVKLTNAVEALKKASDDIAAAIASKGGTKLAKNLAKMSGILYIGFIVNAFTEGMQKAKAKSILGILDTPTFGQRLLAATCNAINEAIPGIGGIIPTEVLFSIVFTILDKLGLSTGRLAEQRAAAKGEVEAYNQENGTDYNVEEYIHNVLGEYTIQQKITKRIVDPFKKFFGKDKDEEEPKPDIADVDSNYNELNRVSYPSDAYSHTYNNSYGKDTITRTNASLGAKGSGIYNKNLLAGIEDSKRTRGFVSKSIASGSGLFLFGGKSDTESRASNFSGNISEEITSAGIGKRFRNASSNSVIAETSSLDVKIEQTINIIAEKFHIRGKVKRARRAAQKIANRITQKIGKATVKTLLKASGVITIASIVNAAIEGLQASKAKGILGILATPSPKQRIIAGFINALNEGIPFIGGVIDSSEIYDIFVDVGLFDDETTNNQRAEAKETINAYNKANRTNYDTEEYINNVLNEYTVQQKVVNSLGGSSGLSLKNSFTNYLSPVRSRIGGASGANSNYAQNAVGNIMANQSASIPNVDNLVKDLWKFTDHKKTKISEFESTVKKYKSNSTMNNAVVDTISGTMKMYDSLIRSMNILGENINKSYKDFNKITSSVSSSNRSSGTTSNSVVSKVGEAWNWIKGAVGKAKDTAVSLFTSDEDSSSDDMAIGGSSNVHTRQIGNFRRFGKSTIDENGCGPAVASTVLKSYGRNVDINSAASYAEKRGYVAGKSGINRLNRSLVGGNSNVGTRASYFDDILGSQGISTRYVSNPKNISSAVKSGRPTILLGQDRSNTSKTRSPFGPNPHYVVARGTDRRGNVIIDDPEMNGPTIYNKNILNKTRLGVITGGASGVSGLMSDVVGTAFGQAHENLGTKAGAILKWIASEGSTEEETADATGAEDGSISSGGGGANFTPIPLGSGTADLDKVVPEKYRVLYNRGANGGISDCTNPTSAYSRADSTKYKEYNVLPNCVGWAWGRYSHIASEINGTVKWYSRPHGDPNSSTFNSEVKSMGMTVTKTPTPGAIVYWNNHIAVVESVLDNGDCVVSESEYHGGRLLNTRTLKKSDGYKYGSRPLCGFITNKYVKSSSDGAGSGTDYKPAIWKFLINKGLSEFAVAGIMGCWQAESGNTPYRLEADFTIPSSQRASVVAKTLNGSPADMDAYCLKYVFPNTNSKKINKDKYLLNGYHYPGFGLAQWTANRTKNAIRYLQENNYSFGSLEGQLNFAWYELNTSYKSTLTRLKNATSPENANDIVLYYYESGGTMRSEPTRRKYAREIYNRFKGTVKATTATGSGIKVSRKELKSMDEERAAPEVYAVKKNGISKLNLTDPKNKFNNKTGSASGISSLIKGSSTMQSSSNSYNKELTDTSLNILYDNDSTLFKKMPKSVVEDICLNAINSPNGVDMSKISPVVLDRVSPATRAKLLGAGKYFESRNRPKVLSTASMSATANSLTSASGTTKTISTSTGKDYTSKLDQVISYLDQIVTNSKYNSNLPKLVEIVSQTLDVISGMNTNIVKNAAINETSRNDPASNDAVNNANNEIELMKAKLQAIAQTF